MKLDLPLWSWIEDKIEILLDISNLSWVVTDLLYKFKYITKERTTLNFSGVEEIMFHNCKRNMWQYFLSPCNNVSKFLSKNENIIKF